MDHTVYLSIGTNLGDRKANITSAIQHLCPIIKSIMCSSIYETPPWGYEDQPSFLNMVLTGLTEFSPVRLLKSLKVLEKELGREESFRFGPRLIDMDILFYDQLVYSVKGLKIPHPRIAERAFVLVPMVEIAPDFVHPSLNKTMSELLGDLDCEGIELIDVLDDVCADTDKKNGSNER